MAAQPSVPAIWRIELPNESATRQLAASISDILGANDLVTLSGEIGSGKTTFARALIRHFAADPELEVPSPTFTLMQIYESGRFPIVHADLYRIKSVEEVAGLGWEEAAEGALVLVEWAHKAGDMLSPDRLDIDFSFDPAEPEGRRLAVLTGFGAFAPILARAKAIHRLLQGCGWLAAKRTFMQGDASTRAYERLQKADGSTAVLMISPARTNEPVIRFGKSYRAIARLAETIRPFIAMAAALRGLGLSAPQIYAHDLEAGLALIEDLGSSGVIAPQGPIADRYAAAVGLLAHLHGQSLPDMVPLEGTESYRIPIYDLEALTIEVEVMPDWYLSHIAGVNLSSGARATFVNLWRSLLTEIVAAPTTWTLRDFHSPNLIWLAQREGLARLGLIDFQDCVLGHPAYDLVSLLQDARIDVPSALEIKLLGDYVRLRQADAGFDVGTFARAYAILGAQRATKVLGIFARLDKRDRKPHYLGHIPRIERSLRKDLDHPALADLRSWYMTHLPRLFEGQESR
jgi:tRNA threonylcarbamoyl adenosine modification protein YjeE